MKIIETAFILLFLFPFYGTSQPTPFMGSLYFNLTEAKDYGPSVTRDDVRSGKIRFFAQYPQSSLTYDSLQKAFCIRTYGIAEKCFAILYQGDTSYISFASLESLKGLQIGMPIPLNGKSFSFYNRQIFDVIQSNKADYFLKIFSLCAGCILNATYEMDSKTSRRWAQRKYWVELRLTD